MTKSLPKTRAKAEMAGIDKTAMPRHSMAESPLVATEKEIQKPSWKVRRVDANERTEMLPEQKA